ncbi:hypothetical protein [Algibacter sp. R77976]|uniref:hypothetical protein n=1 Tax=Algibacter sp. R77976 TaxID=3093873 RepID=UPI0037C92341
MIFDKIPVEKVSRELISELKSHCEELNDGVFKVYASSRISDNESKEYQVDTNKPLNIIYYNLRIYEIDENNTSVDFVISWGENLKTDFYEGLEKVCYFEVEYQILKGEKVNFITYDTFYS